MLLFKTTPAFTAKSVQRESISDYTAPNRKLVQTCSRNLTLALSNKSLCVSPQTPALVWKHRRCSKQRVQPRQPSIEGQEVKNPGANPLKGGWCANLINGHVEEKNPRCEHLDLNSQAQDVNKRIEKRWKELTLSRNVKRELTLRKDVKGDMSWDSWHWAEMSREGWHSEESCHSEELSEQRWHWEELSWDSWHWAMMSSEGDDTVNVHFWRNSRTIFFLGK